MTWQSKRRAFLRTAVVATAAGVAGCSDSGAGDDASGDDEQDGTTTGTPTATPEETDADVETPEEPDEEESAEPDEPAEVQDPKGAVDDWLSNTKNYDGKINDKIRRTDVTIGVGVDDGSGSTFAFGKPAIRVTTGTKIQWDWEDPENAHNVKERNGLFKSGRPVESSGKTYTVTLTEPGVYLYKCANHGGALGMRGAIVVEDQQSLSGSPKVDEWLSEYGEYDGRLADKTGQSSVSVTVGASHDGQNRSFDPVAILVDPGTEVVFEWNGRGGSHDVVWEDGDFGASKTTPDASYSYDVTMDEPGVYRYFCRTDRPYNGRGAVVVR